MSSRTVAIAKGVYEPKSGAPVIWFTSLESFSKMFTQERLELLRVIVQKKPDSIRGLAEIVGQEEPDLLVDLKVMEKHGIVELGMSGRGVTTPRLLYDHIQIDLDLTASK